MTRAATRRADESQLRRLREEYEDCMKQGRIEAAQNVLAAHDRHLLRKLYMLNERIRMNYEREEAMKRYQVDLTARGFVVVDTQDDDRIVRGAFSQRFKAQQVAQQLERVAHSAAHVQQGDTYMRSHGLKP